MILSESHVDNDMVNLLIITACLTWRIHLTYLARDPSQKHTKHVSDRQFFLLLIDLSAKNHRLSIVGSIKPHFSLSIWKIALNCNQFGPLLQEPFARNIIKPLMNWKDYLVHFNGIKSLYSQLSTSEPKESTWLFRADCWPMGIQSGTCKTIDTYFTRTVKVMYRTKPLIRFEKNNWNRSLY